MKVYPIKSEAKIKTLKKMLQAEPRNLLILTIGLNTGLRMGDILNLKFIDVTDKKTGDKVDIIEGKSKKHNYVIINKEISRVLTDYLSTLHESDPESYLFSSRKGSSALLVELTKME